jgi:nitric oxide reductase activation protein
MKSCGASAASLIRTTPARRRDLSCVGEAGKQEARTRLLIVLSDGRPYDHDYGERYP